MDPLSITAGIIAVLQLTSSLTTYLLEIKSASKDRVRYLQEASDLSKLLVDLKLRLEDAGPEDPWMAAAQELAVENGPLDQYKAALKRLISKVSPDSKLKKFGEKFTWNFTNAEVKDIFSKIERLKLLIQIALEMDHL